MKTRKQILILLVIIFSFFQMIQNNYIKVQTVRNLLRDQIEVCNMNKEDCFDKKIKLKTYGPAGYAEIFFLTISEPIVNTVLSSWNKFGFLSKIALIMIVLIAYTYLKIGISEYQFWNYRRNGKKGEGGGIIMENDEEIDVEIINPNTLS